VLWFEARISADSDGSPGSYDRVDCADIDVAGRSRGAALQRGDATPETANGIQTS